MASDDPEPVLRATEDAAAIARRVRQRSGVGAGALAAALMGMRDVLEGPPKESAPVVVESSSEPTDIDNEGLRVDVGEVAVASPALPPTEATVKKRRRSPRRRAG
jgi:hypothetical protein